MNRNRTLAIVAVLLLVGAAVGPSAGTAAGTLSVAVDQGPEGTVYVTVTSNGTAVEGASVDVEAENATYDGEGSYTTDANGTVALDDPEEDVTITVTATDANRTASTTADVEAASLDVEVDQARDGTATAMVTYDITGDVVAGATVNVSTVDENDTYRGTGTYTTDANGTIGLPAPEETVTVRLDASADGLEGGTSFVLQNATGAEETYKSFGARVSAFVHSLLGVYDGGIGPRVSAFVRAHNPGNVPDHAGPPDDRGHGPPAFVENQSGDGGNETEGGAGAAGGPPAHVESDDDDEGGPSWNDSDDDGHPGNGKAQGR